MAFDIVEGVLQKYIPEVPNARLVIEEGITKIEQGAFANSDIRAITLPASLTYVEFRAFSGCSELEEVVFSDGIEHVHNQVFADCVKLRSVKLPNTLRAVGRWMFKGCTVLECITLPDSVLEIGDNAFEACVALRSMVIPDSVENFGQSVFLNCTGLEKVKIGAGAKRLGFGTFVGCDSLREIQISEENPNLRSVDGVVFNGQGDTLLLAPTGITGAYAIPEGTLTVKNNAFLGCRQLTAIRFPSTLQSIESQSFFGCDGLTEIEIPANVKQLGYQAFGKRAFWGRPLPRRLERIAVHPEAGSVSVADEVFYLGGKDPLVYPELPIALVKDRDQKRRLALGYCLNPEKYSDAYKKDYLKYVKSQKKALLELAKKLDLPGVEAFYAQLEAETPAKKSAKKETPAKKTAATKLETVANSKAEFQMIDGELGKYVGTAETVVLPDSITGIRSGAFADCSSVKKIVIPSSVETIGPKVFWRCKKLEQVVLLDGVKSVEKGAFATCPMLQTITILSEEISIHTDFCKGSINVSLVTPNLSPGTLAVSHRISAVLATVKAWAEGEISELAPNGKFIAYVKRIKNQLVAEAEHSLALLRVLLEYKLATPEDAREMMELWPEQDPDRKAMLLAYLGDAKPAAPELGEKKLTVAQIKQDWSYDTAAWDKSYTGTESLKGISIKKYKGYKENVEIPSVIGKYSVYGIAAGAFRGNRTIETMVIPDSVFDIGDSAFADCENLKRVEILGEKVKIASHVFSGCKKLEEVVLHCNEVSFAIHPFLNCEKLMDASGFVILDCAGERFLLECRTPITAEELVVPEGVTAIEGRAMGKNFDPWGWVPAHDKLKRVVLSSTVRRIGEGAFADAVALEQVVLPEGLETIGIMAFNGCVALKELRIPASVKTIAAGAFYWCEGLKLRGAAGSEAEAYAKANNLEFIEE